MENKPSSAKGEKGEHLPGFDKKPLPRPGGTKTRRWSAKWIPILLGLLLMAIGIIGISYGRPVTPIGFGEIESGLLVRIPADELPTNTLHITEARVAYQRGRMHLKIPVIDVTTMIGESTEPRLLDHMPGLYEFSQLPGEGDVNVSIAGHRTFAQFFHLHNMSDGDLLYLIYDDIIYRYLFQYTKVVRPDAWEVIEPQGFSALTLTTCHPIGSAVTRLILRAQLLDYQPYSEDFVFVANIRDE